MSKPLTKQDREAILYNMRNPVDGLWPLTEIVERYEATLAALSRSGEATTLSAEDRAWLTREAERIERNVADYAASTNAELQLGAKSIAPTAERWRRILAAHPKTENCPKCDGLGLVESGNVDVGGHDVMNQCACGDGSLAGFAAFMESEASRLRAALSAPPAPTAEPT